jgi:transcriptional regulator with XRE-family HTH domain
MAESIGNRIAYLRQKNGWTQQSLADRLAMSRVAVSHIEMDLTIPSERSVTLMAGVFKLSPVELVEGTTYPRAKAERLPVMTNIYTDLEMDLALLKNDLEWVNRLNDSDLVLTNAQLILKKWFPILENWSSLSNDEHEKKILLEMHGILRLLTDKANHHLA